MKGLSSELLKYKRTFIGKLIVFIPLFFAAYSLVVSAMMQHPLAEANGNTSITWTNILALIFNWWPFLFLPLGYALFAVLITIQEKKAGNYRALRSHDVSPAMLWINKITGMAIYGLLSTVVL
ncbi:MAG: ABC transporter permease, partial [Lachnospiraceae bacterium]|nr:ABC transporter permease [Lachnospiraceae bacterium]